VNIESLKAVLTQLIKDADPVDLHERDPYSWSAGFDQGRIRGYQFALEQLEAL
jgi:hypothetical protein